MDGWLDPVTDRGQLCLRRASEEAALMLGYILALAVALVLTVYLFVAMLFPERF